jgi:hypothetical protein
MCTIFLFSEEKHKGMNGTENITSQDFFSLNYVNSFANPILIVIANSGVNFTNPFEVAQSVCHKRWHSISPS